jgi:D-cysteine desulfhydrase family pyridoxal phosphate-dependent enzyme
VAGGQAWDGLARIALAPLPTPLVRAERFGAAIGAEVWIKRDDIGSIGLAGNKVRKLEFVVADAIAQGADTLVTAGAAQSNHARATACAAAALGLRCVLVLGGDRPERAQGNLLLGECFGAEARFVGSDDWGDIKRALDEAVAAERAAGAAPYLIPLGCSSPLGAVGFAAAYRELLDQLDAAGVVAEEVWHASTSGGTQAGLTLGRHLAGRGPAVRGVSAGVVWSDPTRVLARHASEAAAILGRAIPVAPGDIQLDTAWVGAGYGEPTPECLEAIRLLALTEGILCDPVYSGKGLAALVGAARAGRLAGPAVFWHTGGVPVVFDERQAAALDRNSVTNPS